MSAKRNPWMVTTIGASYIAKIDDEESRLGLISKYDPIKLRQVIAWPDTQKAVRQAAQLRLRKITTQPRP